MKKKNKSQKNPKKGNRKMILKAGLALKNEFYLEASWIISTLLEKRVKTILGRIEQQKPGMGYTFDQNIKRLKYLRLALKHPALTDHFDVQLIDAIRNWKNQRNEVMKDMLVRHITKDRMERLANEGISVYKELNSCIKSFKSDFKEQL